VNNTAAASGSTFAAVEFSPRGKVMWPASGFVKNRRASSAGNEMSQEVIENYTTPAALQMFAVYEAVIV
jgi:hypothetical protein